jgi:drug/metabolite transporter (DMT)-like permease
MWRGAERVGHRVRGFSPVNRYGMVLALIAVTYLVALVSSERHIATEGLIVLQLLTVYLVFGVSDSPRIRRVAGVAVVAAGLVSVLTSSIGSFTDSQVLLQLLYLLNILLYAVAPLVILRHVLRRPEVDAESLVATFCAYVLIGMMFAFTYRFLGSVLPEPFFGTNGAGTLSQDLFFSFVTLTTTGYGDLVPAVEVGQTLAVAEALIGQLFLAGAVAKIVTGWRPKEARRGGGGPPEAATPPPADTA